ncbi:hypothetical protein F4810DRAFT_2773 [Camillea tinctor]|nr:hypothetical protein F4810DRAFT_2773 [Camillea tinctor]
MALGRWKFSSSRNKSSTSSGDQSSNGTTTPTDSEGFDLFKTSSRLRRTLTTFRTSSSKAKKPDERDAYAHLNKPFTKQNLEHQKVLNEFEWNFGRRRPSHGGLSMMSGISPCCSRINTIDYDDMPSPPNQRETHIGFNNSLACDTSQEGSGEESDKDLNNHSHEDFPRVAQIETVQ